MNPNAVELGVFAHVNEGLLKVLGVAVDPLALVATLGDGIELFRTEVTRESHAVDEARWVPRLGASRYNELAKLSEVKVIRNEPVFQNGTRKSFHFGPRESARH